MRPTRLCRYILTFTLLREIDSHTESETVKLNLGRRHLGTTEHIFIYYVHFRWGRLPPEDHSSSGHSPRRRRRCHHRHPSLLCRVEDQRGIIVQRRYPQDQDSDHHSTFCFCFFEEINSLLNGMSFTHF